MNKLFTKSIALIALVGAFTAFSAAKAEAAFTLKVCDDAACSSMGSAVDLVFTDVDLDGVILATTPFAGMEVSITTALSKPALASGMDLSFVVANPTGSTASIWFFAEDTGFAGTGILGAHVGGTIDSGTVTATACQVVGSCFASAPQSGSSFSSSWAVGPAGSDPYAMTLGIAIVGLKKGDTTSGDFRVVPEPATLALFGLGLAGLAARRRRQTN